MAAGEGAGGAALEDGERVIIEDMAQSPALTDALEMQHWVGVRAMQSTPLMSRSGKPVGLLSTHYKKPHRADERALRLLDLLARQAADLIEHAQTEAALRESEERLRLATASSNTGLWDWDIRTNQVHYSPIWKSQIGYEEHEISNSLEEWRSRVHPDDLDRTLATVKAFLAKPWPDYELEFRFRHKNGTYRWILSKGSLLLDGEGKAYRMLGSHIDITARKQAEQELQASREQLRSLIGHG
jgi:PAS domain S-box-containing protein